MLCHRHWFNSCGLSRFSLFQDFRAKCEIANVCLKALQRGLDEKILIDQSKYIMANEKKDGFALVHITLHR